MLAIAIDIDGTITDNRRRINLDAVHEIRRHINRGALIVPATGNTACLARSISVLIGTSGFLIAENGGVIESPKGERAAIGDINVAERAFKLASNSMDLERVNDCRETEVAIKKDSKSNKLKKIIRDIDLNVDVIDSKFAIHIREKGTNKGMALKEIAKMVDVDLSDFVAIGDSENDIEMVDAAGTGVAVNNSPDELIEVADIVTENENGAGVVEFLQSV